MNNRFFIVLLSVSLFAGFFALGRGDIFEDNEGQRAAPPAAMLRTGDYIIPRLNGDPYLVKPPLLYWTIACVYRIAGKSEFAARTPTALSGVVLTIGIYLLMRKEAGERAARWAALVMLACPYALQRMRYAELDIPLTLATFLAIVAARNATIDNSFRRRALSCVLSGVAFGAAVLLKGPVPFLFFWVAAVATFAVNSGRLDRVMRTGITVSTAAFALEILLKSVAAHLLPAHAHVLGFPVSLIAVMLVWTYLAMAHTSLDRGRIGYWLAAIVIGVALALPWGLAALRQMGWDNIARMLNNQVVERTYTASTINSGAPWYYVIAIVPMLAPWGFLLPFQFSSREWKRQNDLYRFCVLMAWGSILVFSLIAGKEYEYILPCVPFLAVGIGYHAAQIGAGVSPKWIEQWTKYWQTATLTLIGVALAAGTIYFAFRQFSFSLMLRIVPLALAGLAVCLLAIRGRTFRTPAIFVVTLCALLTFLVARSDTYHGDMSPKEISRLASRYAKAGYTVESSKVYPAVDFYGGRVFPQEQHPERVREKLAGQAPYIYLTRKSLLQQAGIRDYKVLTGPIKFKDLILISNQDVGVPGEKGR